MPHINDRFSDQQQRNLYENTRVLTALVFVESLCRLVDGDASAEAGAGPLRYSLLLLASSDSAKALCIGHHNQSKDAAENFQAQLKIAQAATNASTFQLQRWAPRSVPGALKHCLPLKDFHKLNCM